jgi:4-amino-4-deoxy-L-arabinose transferase-like glycosyltransferase
MTPPPGSEFLSVLHRTQRWHALYLLAVCAAIFWPRLGTHGLRSTEGHRAIPGWEALDTGRWLPPTMFEAVYVRKPPGMPWAVAASSALLGQTEFAARLPSALSATAMALLAFVFATRWFGPPWGLIAGLAQALMPRFWPASRTADIEALLCLGVQLAAFTMVHAIVHRRDAARTGTARWALLAAAGLIVALLAKAHAGLPVIAGVIVAAATIHHRPRTLVHPVVLTAVALAAAAVAPVAWRFTEALRAEGAVSEDFAKFFWDSSRLGGWILFPLAVLWSGLPASLALLFPWGPDARREAADDARAPMFAVTRCLASAFLISIFLYWLAGVTNERYAMPSLVLLPPIVASVARGVVECFTPARAVIARLLALGSPLSWPIALLLAAAAFIFVVEPREAASSARDAALALAPHIPADSSIYADGLIGAKPELLWYAARAARLDTRPARPIWDHTLIAAAALPSPGSFLLLNHAEAERYRDAGHESRLVLEASGRAHTTEFVLYRVRE